MTAVTSSGVSCILWGDVLEPLLLRGLKSNMRLKAGLTQGFISLSPKERACTALGILSHCFPQWGFILSSLSWSLHSGPTVPSHLSPGSILLPSGCCSELPLLQLDNSLLQDSNVRVFHRGGNNKRYLSQSDHSLVSATLYFDLSSHFSSAAFSL